MGMFHHKKPNHLSYTQFASRHLSTYAAIGPALVVIDRVCSPDCRSMNRITFVFVHETTMYLQVPVRADSTNVPDDTITSETDARMCQVIFLLVESTNRQQLFSRPCIHGPHALARKRRAPGRTRRKSEGAARRA